MKRCHGETQEVETASSANLLATEYISSAVLKQLLIRLLSDDVALRPIPGNDKCAAMLRGSLEKDQ